MLLAFAAGRPLPLSVTFLAAGHCRHLTGAKSELN